MGESVEENPVKYSNANEDLFENMGNNTGKNIIRDSFEQTPESFEHTSEKLFIDGTFKQTSEGRMEKIANSDLNHKVRQMIEKSDGVWKCKVCGKTNPDRGNMGQHAETHIEGMSHDCHICNKSFSTRPSLRSHIKDVHSELLSCDLCGRSGMTKKNYYSHISRQHKTMSGTLL